MSSLYGGDFRLDPVDALGDATLFELAKWVTDRRDEVRREITRRAGAEVRVYIEFPPVSNLTMEELTELRQRLLDTVTLVEHTRALKKRNRNL